MSRNDIRNKIFSKENTAPTIRSLVLFGVDVEMRQPTIKAMMALQAEDDERSAIATILINHIYVPGTEETVFDDADYDTIVNMPMSADLAKIGKTFRELTSVDLGSAEGN